MHENSLKARLLVGFIICSLPVFAQSSSPLMQAIRNDDVVQVGVLLNSNADVKFADADGDNALMYAALYSTANCMKMLLDKGADPNAKNKLGETALMWCSQDLYKVTLLLNHKASPNILTEEKNTAFLTACVGASQSSIIRLMLQHGADPLVVNSRNETSLIYVSQFGDTADARLLVKAGVNVNAKGKDGQSALFYAIKTVNKAMVFWLLDNGADGEQLDSYKSSPLSYAVTIGDMDMVKRFLSLTKNINHQDTDQITALMWAVYSEHDNPAIVQVMLDAGAKPELKDNKGKNALDWAMRKGNTETVALLKKAMKI